MPSQELQRLLQLATANPLLEPAMAGLIRRVFLRHLTPLAPVPNTQSTPFSTERVSCHGRPRLFVRHAGRSTDSTTAHCSSFNSQRPVTALRGSQSSPRIARIGPSTIYETGSRAWRLGRVVNQADEPRISGARRNKGDSRHIESRNITDGHVTKTGLPVSGKRGDSGQACGPAPRMFRMAGKPSSIAICRMCYGETPKKWRQARRRSIFF